MLCKPYIRHRKIMFHTGGTSYTPQQLAKIYNFPDSDGAGQTIGFVELGGSYNDADLQAVGVDPSRVRSISVDGGKPQSDGPQGADGEVALDIQVALLAAPGARGVVAWCPNVGMGIARGIQSLVDAGCDVISVSWGAPEDGWANQDIVGTEAAIAYADQKGVTVLVAAGDNGSSDGEYGKHVDYPAASPKAIGCGGTSLHPIGGKYVEVVWDNPGGGATGGGVSTVFGVPAFQSSLGLQGRGVPDMAANADPDTGYQIVVDGQPMVIGGTSAVSPLLAALVARINHAMGKRIGALRQSYSLIDQPALLDVTQGGNGAYQATSGWDACTGCGRPVGDALLTALQSDDIPVATGGDSTNGIPITIGQDIKSGSYLLTPAS